MNKTKNLNPVARVEGRSFLLNILAILLNIIGVTFIVIGFHKNFEGSGLAYTLVGFTTLGISIFGLILMKGRLLMSNFSRILVGGLFIVSGLVKANDPIGFAYKLEEYFEDGALAFRIKEWFGMPEFTLEYLIQMAIPLSIIICIVEILLGVLTILGRKLKLVSILLLGMMLFFTFLTWHTANCDGSISFTDRDVYELSDPIAQSKIEQSKTNKDIKIISKLDGKVTVDEKKQPQCVDDCGCFGDALKGSVGRSLTPAESLWKDIVLSYFILWIALAAFKRGKSAETGQKVFLVGSMIVVIFLSWVFNWYFPVLFAALALFGSAWMLNSFKKWLANELSVSVWVTLLCMIMVTYVLSYDTIKDYRPYAIGTNLKEKMSDGQEGQYLSLLVYENVKTKELIEYDASSKEYIDSKIWEDKSWVYKEMTQKEIIPMRIPSITEQFNPYLPISQLSKTEKNWSVVKEIMSRKLVKTLKVWDLQNDYMIDVPLSEFTQEDYPSEGYEIRDTVKMSDPSFTEVNLREFIVNAERVVVLVSKRLNDANWHAVSKYKEIYSEMQKQGIPMLMLVSSNRAEMDAFRKKYNFNLPIFLNDETELKAITRSNPAMLIIEKGVVMAKYAHRSTPSYRWLKKNIFK